VLKIGYKECRRWVGERAWQSAEGGDVARVPGMGSCGGEGVRIHAADGHAVAPRWGVSSCCGVREHWRVWIGWLAKSVRGANLATTSWVIVMCDTAGEVVPFAGYFGYCGYRRISSEDFSTPAG
jgi:hypothetical protein